MRKITLLASAVVVSALGALQSGCAVAMPFRGPGYDGRSGVTAETPDGTVLVALTSAVLDRARRRPFDRSTGDVADGMGEVDGLVGFSFRRELFGKRAWTMTVWEDEASLARFVRSQMHRDAMRAGRDATLEFRFHSFRAERDEIPVRWSRAVALLRERGTAYPDLGD